jgi:hypothetical protein
MKRFTAILKSIPAIAIVCVIAFFGLKGCIVTTWAPPLPYTTYGILGEDGREMQLSFAPDKKAVVIYGDPSSESFEVVLLKFGWGEQCTHYIGPLYNVSRGAESLFGLRWCGDGARPARINYTILNKFRQGFGDSAFGEIGSEYEKVLYFKDDAIRFAGMWLTEQQGDPELIDRVLSIVDVAEDER